MDENLTENSSISSGKIWWSVLNRERRGDYLGATVQIIPHITNEIKERVYSMASDDVDVVITEIGGTVGDIESQPFLEAIRQVASERPHGDVVFIHVPLIVQIPGSGELKSKPTQHSVKELLSLGIQPDILVCRCDVPITDEIKLRLKRAITALSPEIMIVEIGGTVGDIESQPFLEAIRQLKTQLAVHQCCFIHVTLIPYLSASGELKTKPTQHSVKEPQSIGIQPDVIVCRSDYPIVRGIRSKIGLFCNVPEENVIENLNARSLYEVPLMLEERGLCRVVLNALSLEQREPDLRKWSAMVQGDISPEKECNIALVGKYIELHDAYLSVAEALRHSGIANNARVNIKWIAAEDVERGCPEEIFKDVDGILVPGGFGERGIDGMMVASRYAREHMLPYFGICLGMQIAVIEYARHVLGWADAHSTEVDFNAKHPVINLMEDQVNNIERIGGTLRLGSYTCRLEKDSLAYKLYNEEEVHERHRHRYEFNNEFLDAFRASGMKFTGWNPRRGLAEIIELPDHPFFVGVQFHPEFKSRPDAAHPIFRGFIAAALEYKAAGK